MNIMKGLAIKNLGLDTENEEQREEWRVENDSQADWCLDMIREYQAEYNRFKIVVDNKISQLQEALEKEKEQAEKNINFFTGKLAQYFATVPKKKTKTQESYKLPSGRLVKKYRNPEFIRKDEELVKWLEENNMTELIKIRKSANWAKLKKKAQVAGDKVVLEDTGEVINGVKAVERNPEFKVEV